MQDGLPSSEVYQVIQDRKGFLWFATDKGVSRFDGLKFENFSTRDGLPDNTIIHMFKDTENRIWFISINNRLSYYENDKIIKYRYNDTILKYVGDNNSFIQSFAVEKNGCLHINVHNRKYLMINANGEVKKNEPIA